MGTAAGGVYGVTSGKVERTKSHKRLSIEPQDNRRDGAGLRKKKKLPEKEGTRRVGKQRKGE